MKSWTLFALLSLFLGLSSCLPDGASTLTPEVVEVGDEPDANTNFKASGDQLDISHGYLFKIGENQLGWTQHHLVLTEGDVREGGAFTGNSAAITITINASAGTDLSGDYTLGENSTAVGTATVGKYHQNLRFYQARNYAEGHYQEGSVTLVQQGDEYVISMSLSSASGAGVLEGVFEGAISEIDLTDNGPIDQTVFEGDNHLKFGDREVGLNYAYLLPYGTADDGTANYRLYLSTEDIAPDASSLTGRSDLVFFTVNEGVIEQGGKFTFTHENDDYLNSILLTNVNNGYYCKNMDFLQNTADDDIPMDRGEIDIEVIDEEIIIAFSGEANAGHLTKGLYRGQLIFLD